MKEWKYEKKPEADAAGFGPKAEVPEGLREECRKARDKGLDYLRLSSRTEDEMRRKLAEQGFSPASVADAVDFLKSYRYLDDEDYARRYLERYGKKKSEKQIRFDLSRKGVPADILDRVLEETPVDEEGQIAALLERKRFSAENAGREERAKTAASLIRKGFSYEAVRKALDRYGEPDID